MSLKRRMREKLRLLSRTILSPPNLRVSGGLPLLHGGSSPLRNGGSSPLRNGGYTPPHRLGFTTVLHRLLTTPTETQSLLTPKQPHLHLSLTLSITLPHQQANPRRSPCLPFPSPILPFPFSSGFMFTRHHHYPKPHVKIKEFHPISAAFRSGSLPRDRLRSPKPITMPLRPPPEPPPSVFVNGFKDCCAAVRLWSFALLYLGVSVALHLLAVLFPLRPPPKPPWSYYRFVALLRLNLVYGASMAGLISLLLFNNANTSAALKLFDKRPHRVSGLVFILLWVCWHLIVTEETYVTSTFCSGLFKLLSAIAYQGNLVYPENKKCRNVPFISQKSFVSGLEEKTRASLFVIANDWGRKLLTAWMLDWSDRLVYVHIASTQSMSNVNNVCVIFLKMILGCGWEMSQHIYFHSTCNVLVVFV